MHGIVHAGLKRFVREHHGEEGWQGLLKEAGLNDRFYLVAEVYEDDDLVALVEAASRVTGAKVDDIHEAFGRYLTPDLIRLNYALIRPHWRTYELLLNTEDTIHRHVRRHIEGATPPPLEFEDKGHNQLRFTYRSPRNMPGVARGIIRGVADYFDERVSISETRYEDGRSVMDILIG